jgi:hypothetical protein
MKPEVAEGQIPAFFEENAIAPEVPYVGPGVDRKEVIHRAGTKLNHAWTHRVTVKGKVSGMYDESQRVYQTGGELTNFIYWKLRVVSISDAVWQQIRGKVDWIEVIDHERNECWRISGTKFINGSVRYDAGIGPRVGAPMELWTIITSRNTIRQEGR